MRILLLISITLVFLVAPVHPAHADEAGIGWEESGNGLTTTEPADEAEPGSWLEQQLAELVELFITEE